MGNGSLKGTSPRGKPHTIHYLGASLIQFTTSGQAPYRKTCMSMYSIVYMNVMFLYYE
jgi:hypothetical protein